MNTKKLFLTGCLIVTATLASAQYHFKGLQAITAEYAVDAKFDQQVTLGYQVFIGRNTYLGLNGQYERGHYTTRFGVDYFDVQASYRLDNYWLNGTLNFTLLNIGQRIFLDLGAGPTVGMRFVKQVTSYASDVNEVRFEASKSQNETTRTDPVANEGGLKDKLLVGVNMPATLEVYISRHFSLLGRYRAKYLIRRSTDRWTFDTTAGIGIHF